MECGSPENLRLRQRVLQLEQEISHLKNLLRQHNIRYDNLGTEDTSITSILFPEITAWHAKALYSFFKGRKDVYSKRNVNKDGKGVYYPVCSNFWKAGKCPRREGEKQRCKDCKFRQWVPLNQRAIISHLKGELNDGKDVIGIYPLMEDDTCYFLVFDFDHHDEDQPIDWKTEVNFLRTICCQLSIDALVERSRSGNGAHVWLFFESAIPAKDARKFGSCLLTKGAQLAQQKTFLAYDRMLPAQDTMPEGGLGNLIALPLQGNALRIGNSAFVDENWNPYPDQWKILLQIKRIGTEFVQQKIQEWGVDSALGLTSTIDTIESPEPWKNNILRLSAADVNGTVLINESSRLYIRTQNLKPRICNQLRRLSAFRNPLYYRNRAMGLSVKGLSRIIACFEEGETFIGIPRGKREQILGILNENHIPAHYHDERQPGRKINIHFTATLYEEQQKAADAMLNHENGILQAATAFGKTAVGAYLIATRKVNTLILVHNREIMKNWVDDLHRFIRIEDPLPTYSTPSGQIRTRKSHIGRLFASHCSIGGVIDVAMITSMGKEEEISPIVQNYGMVLMDECHHAAAYQAYCVLNRITAKYVYGLTATPKRDDGMEQKVLMTFGPIRYRYTAKQRVESRSILHFVYPRYTRYWYSDQASERIQDIYQHMIQDELRNELIIQDVIKCIEERRTPLILTKFKKQAYILLDKLKKTIQHLFLLHGGRKNKEREALRAQLQNIPANEPMAIIAIGQYIGEGFNYPRLDTLMLATPISWEGNVEQYAGRLHRDYEGKKDVLIYDYVDMRVRVLNKMYAKRLKTYKKMGYYLHQDCPLFNTSEKRVFFESDSFEVELENDILTAREELIISSTLLSYDKVRWLFDLMSRLNDRPLKITVFTIAPDSILKRAEGTRSIIKGLRERGIQVMEHEQHHEQFVVIDRNIVWYGTADFLAHRKTVDNVIRMENKGIAADILYAMSAKSSGSSTPF